MCDFEVKGYPDEEDPASVKVLKRSQETLTIAGKSVVCDVVDAVIDDPGIKCHFNRWTSRQVPGLMVKNVILDDESPATMETVNFETPGPRAEVKKSVK